MRHLKTAIRAFISLGLLAYLVYIADPVKISEVLVKVVQNAGLLNLGLALLAFLLAISMMTARWHILLRRYQMHWPFPQLFGFYLIGLFFNNFLPTSIGGDIYRVYKVSEDRKDRTVAIATIITERMLGIAATLFLAIVSLFFVSQYFHDERLLYISITLFLGISTFFFIMTRNRPFKLLLLIFNKITIFNIGERINKLFEAIHELRTRRRIFGYVFIFSVFSQMSVVFMNLFLARALSIQIDLGYLFLVVTITIVLTMLPSINGVGIRDLGYVTLLAKVGISNAAAISLSFLNLLLPMTISIWGAVLFIIQKRKSTVGEIDAYKTSI
jgi:uncharacterized protein (TIRG00374 family)